MAFAARVVLLAIDFVLLSAPPILQGWIGGDTRAYAIVTVLLVLLNAALAALWTRESDSNPNKTLRLTGATGYSLATLVVAVLAAAIVLATGRTWLHEILIQPHDAQRADMLIVIQEGIRRFARGLDPYVVYHVPWDAPLPYGPVMWLPLAIPLALRVDIRFVTIAGMLFVPIACAAAAARSAMRARWWNAAAWLALLTAIAVNPDLRRFVSIGHTPVYWPLLALLAWLSARGRWRTAAVVAGLLIVARTTMVAIAPVVLMAVWWKDRSRFSTATAALAAAAVLPFAPFAFWNWRSLLYAMYGSYQAVMKGFVWTQTTWAQHTVGFTGWLLQGGWPAVVEPLQLLTMAIVYALAWRSIRRGGSPLLWMGLALFAFSLTTLWPVLYIYFDVFLLLVCAALAEDPLEGDVRPGRIWIATLAASGAVVLAVAWLTIPAYANVQVGAPDAQPFLHSGFAVAERVGDRTFAWVDGTHAEVLLTERSRRDQVIEIDCRSALPGELPQQMTVRLNGLPLGATRLAGDWQRVTLPAPGRIWQVGVNVLDLDLSAAVTPREVGGNLSDSRRLSVAVDRVSVRPR